MIKIAVLDDYQNIFEEFIDVDKYKDKFEFTIFNEPFQSETEAILALEKFDALFIMRERTPLTKSLLEGLKNLKYILTSGMRNKSIDLEYTRSKNNYCCRANSCKLFSSSVIGSFVCSLLTLTTLLNDRSIVLLVLASLSCVQTKLSVFSFENLGST